MHIDGFRFDLAAAVARGQDTFDKASAFLTAVGQDEVLAATKRIAEPWDTGGSYAEGDFPDGWTEWNDRYRGTVRDFWLSQDNTLADFATRITGSSDLFGHGGRRPTASLNLITCHDGFTLADLVSYNVITMPRTEMTTATVPTTTAMELRHRRPQQRRVALRAQQQRNFLATLLLSSGVPMMLGR
jgi:isoamylase